MLSSQAVTRHWPIVPLTNKHQRDSFDCGETALNTYFKQYANQHAKNNISRTFVALPDNDSLSVAGFYTLSAGSITFDNLPAAIQKRLPRYPIPIARIGRLAVDKHVQGLGLGTYILMDALQRCISLSQEIGIAGILVDAKHEKAKNFYLKYGFITLTNSPLTLFISTLHWKLWTSWRNNQAS